MVLDNLLVKLFCLMNLLHQGLDLRLVLNILRSLLFFKLCLLVSKLHLYTLVVGPLSLDLIIEFVVFGLDAANLLVREIYSTKDVWLSRSNAAC